MVDVALITMLIVLQRGTTHVVPVQDGVETLQNIVIVPTALTSVKNSAERNLINFFATKMVVKRGGHDFVTNFRRHLLFFMLKGSEISPINVEGPKVNTAKLIIVAKIPVLCF